MSDKTLYLYTSLTAGSSHIVTATARLETILKANKLAFRAIDVATDDAARKLWGRRSKGKKLPGLVKFGTVVGDLEEIEEWNEYGELRMQINSVEDFDSMPATSYPAPTTTSASTPTPAETPAAVPKQSTVKIQNPPAKEVQKDDSITVALRQAGEEAATKAKENARGDTTTTTTTTKPEKAPAPAPEPAPEPAAKPAAEPVAEPATKPTAEPVAEPAVKPAAEPAPEPIAKPAAEPAAEPVPAPAPTPATTEEKSTNEQAAASATPGEEKKDSSEDTVRRKSVVPEIETDFKRPPLVPEVAAVSSANIHADNAQALGLVEHHRGSIVSATSPEEREKVAQDLRKSISGGRQEILESLKEARNEQVGPEETIEEASVSDEEGEDKDKDKDKDKENKVAGSKSINIPESN